LRQSTLNQRDNYRHLNGLIRNRCARFNLQNSSRLIDCNPASHAIGRKQRLPIDVVARAGRIRKKQSESPNAPTGRATISDVRISLDAWWILGDLIRQRPDAVAPQRASMISMHAVKFAIKSEFERCPVFFFGHA
jgi:hypothetical protein